MPIECDPPMFPCDGLCCGGHLASRYFDFLQTGHVLLAGLQISGTIPADIGTKTGLRWITSSMNRISGTLPTQLGLLSSHLHNFDIANNNISGTIPTQFGWLSSSLGSYDRTTGVNGGLYLNDNLLSGSLPSQLNLLNKLSPGHCALTNQQCMAIGYAADVCGSSENENTLTCVSSLYLPDACASGLGITCEKDEVMTESLLVGGIVSLVVLIAIIAAVAVRCSRLHQVRGLALLELQELKVMDVRDGVNEAAEIQRYLMERLKELGIPGSKASNSEMHRKDEPKFASSLQDLVMGEPKEAALGLVHLMRASPAAVRGGMASGVTEIESEFEAFCQIVQHVQVEDRPWWAACEIAEEALECCRYCLHERAGSSDAQFPNSPFGRDCDANGVRTDRCTPSGGMLLTDFLSLSEAQTAKLELAHVLALRLYTTAAYKIINGPLRERWGGQQHPFPVTVCFLSDALGKLRAVGAEHRSAHVEFDLWRGLSDRSVHDSFCAQGGTEMAPMSTTSDLKVALSYATSAKHSLLFKLRTDSFMRRGAALSWCSAFPDEFETLFPPLTCAQQDSNFCAPETDPSRCLVFSDGYAHLFGLHSGRPTPHKQGTCGDKFRAGRRKLRRDRSGGRAHTRSGHMKKVVHGL